MQHLVDLRWLGLAGLPICAGDEQRSSMSDIPARDPKGLEEGQRARYFVLESPAGQPFDALRQLHREIVGRQGLLRGGLREVVPRRNAVKFFADTCLTGDRRVQHSSSLLTTGVVMYGVVERLPGQGHPVPGAAARTALEKSVLSIALSIPNPP